MESSTTDSRGQQMPEFPVPAALAAPQKSLKTFGQSYQYAETLQNPFPEVVFSGVASTSAVRSGDGANEASADSSIRPGTAGSSKEPVLHEDVWVEPPEPPWYKEISRRSWIAIIICTVGITGVLMAILGAMNKFSGPERSDPSISFTTSLTTINSINTVTTMNTSPPTPSKTADKTSTDSTTTTTAATTTGTATATSSNPTSIVSPSSFPFPPPPADPSQPPLQKIDCSAPSTFLTSITWIGTDINTYTGEFAQAGSASACCELCAAHAPGCAGWLYNASSAFTPCTKIVITAGDQKDEKCPKGYAGATTFAKGDGEGVAGLGPCGGGVRTQE